MHNIIIKNGITGLALSNIWFNNAFLTEGPYFLKRIRTKTAQDKTE